MEQLIVIRSVMKPRDYSTLRALLKKEQGEKVNPSIFKLENSESIRKYLEKEKIIYDLYEKKEEKLSRSGKISQSQLEKAYQEAYSDKDRERECRI
jgi:hypothetical protein